MRYVFLCLFLSLVLMANAQMDIAPVLLGEPTTEIEFSEREQDFGTITQGERVSHTYTFTNTGDRPLVLMNAKGSCGCTVPSWPHQPVLPGESASITVEFNSANKVGARNQKVTITANTEPANTVLYLRGVVVLPEDAARERARHPNDARVRALDAAQRADCVVIYPNPTADVLHLKTDELAGREASVRIFSKTGQLMAERHFPNLDATVDFEVSHYPAGEYLANISIAGQPPVVQCFAVTR